MSEQLRGKRRDEKTKLPKVPKREPPSARSLRAMRGLRVSIHPGRSASAIIASQAKGQATAETVERGLASWPWRKGRLQMISFPSVNAIRSCDRRARTARVGGVSPDAQENNAGKDCQVRPLGEQRAEKGWQRNCLGGYRLPDLQRPKWPAMARMQAQGRETSETDRGGETPAMSGQPGRGFCRGMQ